MVAVSLKKNFFKQKTAYEMQSGDWSSDVCSSDLQEEKGMTEDETAGWHHRLDGHEFE